MEINRLTVVSNRLPIVLAKSDAGKWKIESGSGGLVTALSPVLRDRGGSWIGWLGAGAGDLGNMASIRRVLQQGASETGYDLIPVNLTEEDIHKYYYGFSNEILWPLFHDLIANCNFEPSYWKAYNTVNNKFADTILANIQEGDFIWVHDYHLILAAQYLRRSERKLHTGFFLHTPFPPVDIFIKLPWRFEILEAMLQYDLVGFQTMRDRRNFLGCIRALLNNVQISSGRSISQIITEKRRLLVGIFPISIDYREFAVQAASSTVENISRSIHASLPDRQLILGVDRLDYSKGIPLKLAAFAEALLRHPELRRRISLVQVVVPSRRNVLGYETLKREIERFVGEINGQFTEKGWIPIIYIYGSLDRVNLLGYYRSCEIALITPLKDGMNLVAKEYCAASLDMGVLVLSEFAGAASQMWLDALLVNPFDREGVADAIYRAFKMEEEERRRRMMRLRRIVSRSDIFRWVNSFLRAAIAKDLNHFLRLEERM